MEVTGEIVREVAELAQLEVKAADIESLAAGMRTILALAGQMQSVNTEGVPPVSNPLDAALRPGIDEAKADGAETDQITETDQRELYQSIAPETEAGFYLVPRVVE